MSSISFRISALIVLYIIVSAQIDVNEATNPLKNSPRSKRWPEQQSGIGPPYDQYNVNTNNQNNYDALTQFATSSQQYNPLNYYETQSSNNRGRIKREPQFDFIPDFSNLFQNIQKNIPNFSWFPTNNPTTYTQVIEGPPDSLRNVLYSVTDPEQANRIIQIYQSQNQPPNQNYYYQNNNDYVNRQQANNVQPPVTSENSGNLYNTQQNQQLNSNQQQTFRPPQQQVSVSQQSGVSAQAHSQSAYASSSQWNNGYSAQQNQQANSVNVPRPVEHRPNPSTHSQAGLPQHQNVYVSSAQQYSSNSMQIQPTYSQTSPPHTTTSATRGQQADNGNPRKKVTPKETVRPQVYQTTTTATPVYTRPPAIAYTQKNRPQDTQRPQTISQTSSLYIATPAVINSNNQDIYTNSRIVPTTKRVLLATQPTTNPFSYPISPNAGEQNRITENNRPQQSISNQNDIEPSLGFKKDSLNLYGRPNVTTIEDVSYPSSTKLNTQNRPINSKEVKKPDTPTALRPVPVTIENRYSATSDSTNQVSTTSKPVKKCETPASQPVPNFIKPGRRISNTKCREYVWLQQERVSKIQAKEECYRAQGKGFNILGTGGVPALYPHTAAIGWRGYNNYWLFKCGGALISQRFVLTSAHCSQTQAGDSSVVDPVPGLIRLGDRDVAEQNRYGTVSVDVGIRRIIVHPEYSARNQYNDIALIELEDDVVFTKHVQPACLWTKADTSDIGNEFIATGWGTVDTGLQNNPPPALQKVLVNTIDKDTCNNLMNSYTDGNGNGVTDNQICGVNLNGTLDICQGDPGTPLQVKIPLFSDSEGPLYSIIGVAPYRCGRADLPVAYTRVSSVISWIENIVWMSDY